MSSRLSAKQLANVGRAHGANFHLSDGGRQIVSALNRVLRASVALFDADKDEIHHLESSPDRRLAVRNGVIDSRRFCALRARINDRWTLIVSSWRRLHPDAESLLKWAADKLAAYLPRKATDESTSAPFGGGGGESGGGAEAGIPAWWVRDAGNN